MSKICEIEVERIGVFDYPNYSVGSDGIAYRNLADGTFRPLAPAFNKAGYAKVTLCNFRGSKQFYVHLLVAEAFLGPCPDGLEVCHGPNGLKDNTPSNLRHDTHRNNILDKLRDKTIPVGENHHLSKLTEASVLKMRKLFESGTIISRIAEKFGVSWKCAQAAVLRRTWTHL